jgi:hypothetical protein
MKMRIVILALVILGTISSAHAQYGRNRANYRTCSNLEPVCVNNNAKVAGAATKCAAAKAKCMTSGIWTGLDGRTVANVDKQ